MVPGTCSKYYGLISLHSDGHFIIFWLKQHISTIFCGFTEFWIRIVDCPFFSFPITSFKLSYQPIVRYRKNCLLSGGGCTLQDVVGLVERDFPVGFLHLSQKCLHLSVHPFPPFGVGCAFRISLTILPLTCTCRNPPTIPHRITKYCRSIGWKGCALVGSPPLYVALDNKTYS